MNRYCIMLLSALLSPIAGATDAWPPGDAKLGKPLHEQSCIACHTKMYGGDGSKMYTRAGRQLSDRNELVQRVAGCNAQFNVGWFPEDEAHVAAYLNAQYYKFR